MPLLSIAAIENSEPLVRSLATLAFFAAGVLDLVVFLPRASPFRLRAFVGAFSSCLLYRLHLVWYSVTIASASCCTSSPVTYLGCSSKSKVLIQLASASSSLKASELSSSKPLDPVYVSFQVHQLLLRLRTLLGLLFF